MARVAGIPPPEAAVIVVGYDFGLPCFWADAYLAYYLMTYYFGVPPDSVAFLAPTISPEAPFPTHIIDAVATKENVRYYFSSWLRQNSGLNTYIYITSHGAGFNITRSSLEGGRWDTNGDEGNEHFVNGTWRGVDEGIMLQADNSIYWDDEMKEDLNWTLTKAICTVMLQNCYIEGISNMTCFSGGFIDNLSNINARTVITSANETGVSYLTYEGENTYPFSPFTYHFFTCILGCRVEWGGNNGIILRYDEPISWAYSQSLRGAYEYALQNDLVYIEGKEFPWFDDDGNRLPTFINNTEVLDFPENGLDLMRWLQHDINYDGKVNMKDVAIVSRAMWTCPTLELWNRQADVFPNEDWKVDTRDLADVSHDFGKTT